MTRTYIGDLKDHIGEMVSISGWISVVRDQGKMVFFDIRDMTGTVQTVVLPKSPVLELAKKTSRESSIRVSGMVNKRPEKNIDKEKPNGDIEMVIETFDVLNEAQPIPFELMEDTAMIGEETRLQYRYLDLRSERMQRNA